MKYCIAFLISLISVTSLSAQQIVKMGAVKANNYGVAYSLPKTTVEITLKYTKTTKKAGEFYKYAERYLSVANPIVEDETSFSLNKIEAQTIGVVDKSKTYLVEFKVKSTAPFLSLTKDGLICAINDDYTFATKEIEEIEEEKTEKELPNPRMFLSEEILRAGSTAKQAELIAKQIYRLRESRNNVLTGEADNMPPDGEAYRLVIQQIDEQEKALSAMFVGMTKQEEFEKTITITPTGKNISQDVILRFSKKLGIVDADDLVGAPIYLSLKNKEPYTPPILTEKEQKEFEKKFSEGIIYNLPAKAQLSVEYNGKKWINKECEIVQYGQQEVLAPKMFENGKEMVKVIFYPELGKIKQIQ